MGIPETLTFLSGITDEKTIIEMIKIRNKDLKVCPMVAGIFLESDIKSWRKYL